MEDKGTPERLQEGKDLLKSFKFLLGSAATGQSVSVERRAMLLAGVLGGKRTRFLQRASAVPEVPWGLV